MPKRELTLQELALREQLGMNIRARAAAKGLKPAQLAEAAGVALSQQYRIEAGELTADFLYLMKVAALLETGIDALVLGDGAVAPRAGAPVRVGRMTNLADNSVQVGYAGGSVSVKVGKVKKPG